MTNLKEINYNEYSIEDLEVAKGNIQEVLRTLKGRLKDELKETKQDEKKAKSAYGLSVAKQGAIVTVTYKGKEVTGKVTKTTDKTFTMLADIDGTEEKIWRYYHAVVKKG